MFVATVYDVTLETMHQLERLNRKTESSKFMFVATVYDVTLETMHEVERLIRKNKSQ